MHIFNKKKADKLIFELGQYLVLHIVIGGAIIIHSCCVPSVSYIQERSKNFETRNVLRCDVYMRILI